LNTDKSGTCRYQKAKKAFVAKLSELLPRVDAAGFFSFFLCADWHNLEPGASPDLPREAKVILPKWQLKQKILFFAKMDSGLQNGFSFMQRITLSCKCNNMFTPSKK